MSKDDFETSRTLLNPYIEIEKRKSGNYAYVNVSTFEDCLDRLIPPFTDMGPNIELERKGYNIYGVVGRTITSPHGTGAYLNIAEPPISRTLMGFLSEDILRRNLPNVHQTLNPSPQ